MWDAWDAWDAWDVWGSDFGQWLRITGVFGAYEERAMISEKKRQHMWLLGDGGVGDRRSLLYCWRRRRDITRLVGKKKCSGLRSFRKIQSIYCKVLFLFLFFLFSFFLFFEQVFDSTK
jgi:hypothetical protein